MSESTNIIDRVRGLSLDSGVLDGAVSGFRDVPTNTDVLPFTEISQVVAKLSAFVMPDASQVSGNREGQLTQLLEGGISNPADILGPVTQQFEGIFGLVAGDTIKSFTGLFDSFREIFTNFPSDPMSLFSALREPLVGILDILVKDTRLLGLQRYSQQIEQLSTAISGDAQEVVNIIRTRMDQAKTMSTGPVDRAKEGTTAALNGTAADYNSTELNNSLQALFALFVPEAGSSLAQRITALNTGNEAEITTLKSDMETAKNALTAFGNQVVNGLDSALNRYQNVSAEKLGQSLEVAYDAIGKLNINNLLDLGLGLNEVFGSIRQILGGIDPAALLKPMSDALQQMGNSIGEIGLNRLQDSVVSALTEAKEKVEEVGRLQIELTASLHNIISNVTTAINEVNLSGMVDTIRGTISQVEPFIDEVKPVLDSIDSAVGSVLDTIANALSSLSDALLNEETGVKKQIEDFLDRILDALDEAGLRQVLEDLAETVDTAFEGLKEVSFDPVIETVTGELEEMRGTLSEIDVSSLNELLRKALKAALAVVVELGNRFKAEVQEKLLDGYDKLVVDNVESSFKFLQEKFAELLSWVEVLEPGFLIREAGLVSLYEQLQEQVEGFRPGILLKEVDELFNEFKGQLDKFSPATFLGGITSLFDKLKEKVNTLSPAQLIDPLEKLLTRLKDEAKKIDITSFTDSLRENISALTNIVDNISFDSVRNVLHEVYAPIVQGINAVNPEPVFRPILNFKQGLIDAVNQADLSSLQPVLSGVGGDFDRAKLENVKSGLLTRIDEIITGVNGAKPADMISRLRTPANAVKTAAAALPTAPGFESHRADIIRLGNELDPFPALSPGVDKFNTIVSTLESLKSGTESSLAGTGNLASNSQKADEVFTKLTPEVDPAGEIKSVVTGIINAAFENFALDEVQRTYDSIRTAVDNFSPEHLLSEVQSLMDGVVNLLREIGDPEALVTALEEVASAFTTVVDNITLEPLKADLETAFSALTAKLDELNPARIIEAITEQYNNLVGVAETIMSKISGIIERLDKIYNDNVIKVLAELHPQVILIEPLENAFKEVMDLIKGLDINIVFEPILKHLEQLRKELEGGLEQVGDKLFQALGAIPL